MTDILKTIGVLIGSLIAGLMATVAIILMVSMGLFPEDLNVEIMTIGAIITVTAISIVTAYTLSTEN